MTLPRKYRILTALIALFGMLFMQAAIASHACAGLQGGTASSMAAGEAPMPSMPGCDQPDPDQPALCHAHCLDGKSSLDKPPAPSVSPAAVIVSAIVPRLEPVVASRELLTAQPSFLLRTTAPPIAIRHCCLRI